MARVVVVGGGFAGLSAAGRIAKLRHQVVLLEASDRLGGRLRGVEHAGRRWSQSPETFTLPGVLRDLFRKSGRTIDRVLEIETVPGRRHVFTDGTVLDLPMGTRGAQHDAVVALTGRDEWSPFVDRLVEPWDVLRRQSLDQVLTGRDAFTREQWRTLRPRRTVHAAARTFDDPRVATVLRDTVRLQGDDPRRTPAFTAVQHYLERNFGLWHVVGGREVLADGLTTRMEERRVDVRLGTSATGVVLDGGQVRGVETDAGTLPADVVVWCAPRWPAPLPEPSGLRRVPPSQTYVRLGPHAPALPQDVVVHAEPPLRMWEGGDGCWTIEHFRAEDPLDALARCGIDLRDHVEERWDRSPTELVTAAHWGWQWQGWRTGLSRPGVAPSGGLFHAGAHAHPGASLEMIGEATAAIAAAVGKP